MAVASAEARADEAGRRAADLEQQLAAASAAQSATPEPAAASASAAPPDSEAAASKEAFLQSRVAELTAQLEEFRGLAAAVTPRRPAGRDAAVEKLGSPDQGFAGCVVVECLNASLPHLPQLLQWCIRVFLGTSCPAGHVRVFAIEVSVTVLGCCPDHTLAQAKQTHPLNH